jgi:ubiquinone/menaquinone biosynthesis C-methylase UbiE
VQAVYSGPEGDLWELIMGEQIHMGGFASSQELAETACIRPGTAGVDLCCCSGAGMRFLIRFRKVKAMQGVDATDKVIQQGRKRCAEQGHGEAIQFVRADVCQSGLPSAEADFVWGEDAWCYVVDKALLIREATRLVRPGGTIAFTDWLEGPNPLSEREADRFLQFMKFPSLANTSDYTASLKSAGCEIVAARDTGRFAPSMDLYLEMLEKQLTYDALRIIGFDGQLMEGLGQEMKAIQQLAREGKLIQAMFVARKPR